MKKYKVIIETPADLPFVISEKEKDIMLKKIKIVSKNLFCKLDNGNLINVLYVHHIKQIDTKTGEEIGKDLINQGVIKLKGGNIKD